MALRAEGLLYREIAERLGLSISTVHSYASDPDGAKNRARKAKQAGVCTDCGVATSYQTGGPSERCIPCNGTRVRALSRRWILDSFEEWNDLFGVPPTATDWSMGHAAGRPWPPPSTVQDIFGSWNAGRAAAGFDTLAPGRCGRDGDDPRVCEETVRLYRAGLSCAAVGELMGVSRHAVYHRLITAGEPRRDLGRPKATERAAA